MRNQKLVSLTGWWPTQHVSGQVSIRVRLAVAMAVVKVVEQVFMQQVTASPGPPRALAANSAVRAAPT